MDQRSEPLQNALSQIEHASSAVLSHKAIEKLSSGNLSLNQLKVVFTEYRPYCDVFPRLLSAVAANTPDDITRFTLIDNLYDEHGNGDITKSHRTLYDRFLASLGVPADSEPQAAVTTERYVSNCLEFCKDSHYLCGLGFLGPGTESFTNAEYSSIYKGLRQVKGAVDLDLEFWEVHIDVDEDHAAECIQAISACCHTEKDVERVLEGAMFAIEAERAFWDGINGLLSGD